MKKLKHTPNSKITSPLRRLSMYSRERAAVLKRAGGICEYCGVKAKLQAHHQRPINWGRIIRIIRQELLVSPDEMDAICHECHEVETAKQREERKNEPK